MKKLKLKELLNEDNEDIKRLHFQVQVAGTSIAVFALEKKSTKNGDKYFNKTGGAGNITDEIINDLLQSKSVKIYRTINQTRFFTIEL